MLGPAALSCWVCQRFASISWEHVSGEGSDFVLHSFSRSRSHPLWMSHPDASEDHFPHVRDLYPELRSILPMENLRHWYSIGSASFHVHPPRQESCVFQSGRVSSGFPSSSIFLSSILSAGNMDTLQISIRAWPFSTYSYVDDRWLYLLHSSSQRVNRPDSLLLQGNNGLALDYPLCYVDLCADGIMLTMHPRSNVFPKSRGMADISFSLSLTCACPAK